MKEITLNNSCVESKKTITEFINWKCPICKQQHRTIEWAISNQELYCNGCKNIIKYVWV